MNCIPLKSNIIYGPVKSRRLGNSLGINLSPCDQKSCIFDCVYCQYGFTEIKTESYDHESVPTPEEVKDALEKFFMNSRENISYITFSGNGEPTLHPNLPEILDVVENVRNKYSSNAKIAILSNSSKLSNSKILETLIRADVPILKLDVGSEEKFERVNRPMGVHFSEIVEGLKKVDDFVLQSLKFRGEISNADNDLNDWLDVVDRVNPRKVQLYTLDRPVSLSLEKVSIKYLKHVKSLLSDRDIRTEIFA